MTETRRAPCSTLPRRAFVALLALSGCDEAGDGATSPRSDAATASDACVACGADGSPGDGGHAGPDAGPTDGGAPLAPTRTITFTASDATFLSPERGFYTTTNLATARDLAYVRGEGKTLVYGAVHLDAYLGGNHEGELPAALFTDVQAGFDAVRAAGLKVIVRFQYDDGEGYPEGANDASEAAMARQLAQLKPLLAQNEDVIFTVQAGLIGAWGEWHTSQNFVDGPDGKESRGRVVDALLAAVPSSRRIALRYPAYKRMFTGEEPATLEDATSEAKRGRIGHHNDCFLASDDDVGTYQYEPQDVLESFLAVDTLAVPIGGETCAEHARNACNVATAEMARFHYVYLNDQYHPAVLQRWVDEGCRVEIEQRLGYRLRLSEARVPDGAHPGDAIEFALTFVNDGFASPTNARPVTLTLTGDGAEHAFTVPVDVRTLVPGTTTVRARTTLPATLPAGDYALRLALPDAAASLSDPAYALRLANEGLWDEARGDHRLGTITLVPR